MNVPPPPPNHDRGTPPGGYPPPPGGHGPPHGKKDGAPPTTTSGWSQGPPGAPGTEGVQGPTGAPGQGSSATQYPLATWRSRAAARGVDLVVVALPALVLALVLSLAWAGLQSLSDGSTSDLSERLLIMLSVTFFLLYTGYETFALLRWGQTVGKRMMGLKVGPVAGVGRLGPLPPTAVMVRSAVFVFPVLLFFLPTFLWWLLVAVVAAFTGGMAAWNLPNHQGLHDKVAGTMVLDVR